MYQYANGFEPDRYLSRSWALLTRDKGWIKPVLVLALVNLVPIIGPISMLGYILEWARLTAWGIDAAPKQKRVDVGQVITSGWRGTVIGVAWAVVLWGAASLVEWALGLIPGESRTFVPELLNVAFIVLFLMLGMVMVVAQLRSAIYQKIAPGFRLDRIFDMARHDFGGLMRMLGMLGLGLLALLAVALIFLSGATAIVVPYAVSFEYGMLPGQYALIAMISSLLGSLAPITVLLGYAAAIVSVITRMLVITGVGLWMRQFDVPHWGKSSDPLPTSVQQRGNEAPAMPGQASSSSPADTATQADARWYAQEPSQASTTRPEATSGYQQGAYRPDQPGDEGQAGQMPGSPDYDSPIIQDDGVEHLF